MMLIPLRRFIVYLCFLLLWLALPAAALTPADSLVRFSELSFNSATEKDNFLQLARTHKADVIDLLLAPYNKSEAYSSKSAHDQINDFVNFLQKETAGLSNSKRVKKIYKYVHHRLLFAYKLNNSFSGIFENGEYNCVSASALYAIIFQRLGIPFQIIEAPQHVYLVTYPQTERIFIETTSPENGYLKVNENDMTRYIKHLRDSKLISQEEYETSSSSALFDKYYYSTSGVELDKMPGIQYFNYAVYYLNDKNYDKALAEIKKAFYIEPSERNKYLLESVLAYQVSNNNYNDARQVDNLVILCRFNNTKSKDLSNEHIRHEFARVMNDQLIRQADYVQFDTSFVKICRTVSDTSLKKDLAFDYHYELARLGLIGQKNRDYELAHLNAAYKINPQHINLQNIILAYVIKLVDRANDPTVMLKTMTYFDSAFVFLNDNAQYNVVKADCLLELAYQNLSLNDIKHGENYLKEFETLCEQHTDLKADERFVEKAYSQAASYYYKKGNTAKTRQLLNTGIKYAPESFGLRMRLSQAR